MALSLGRVVRIGTTIRGTVTGILGCVPPVTSMNWQVAPAGRGINFVGYRIWSTHKLLRKSSVQRAKRKLKVLQGDKRRRFLVAWRGHARHADCYHLLQSLKLQD